MQFFKLMWKLVKKVVYDRQEYTIYEYDPVKQGEGLLRSDVRKYTRYGEIPKFVRARLFPYLPLLHVMFYRLIFRQAVLYCIHTDTELVTYGWIQSWGPFKKRFKAIASDGIILGQYWTNPRYRRQGYYYGMLEHSIAVIDQQRSNILIYHQVENVASQRVIVKAGFKVIGTYVTVRLLQGLVVRTQAVGLMQAA